MGDLVLGFGLIAGLAVVLFCLGTGLGRTSGVPVARGTGLATVAGLAAYIALLSDNVLLATILPVSNLIVMGDWIPLLCSFFAGLAWSLIPRLEVGSPAEPALPDESDVSGEPADRRGIRSGPRAVLARRLTVVLASRRSGATPPYARSGGPRRPAWTAGRATSACRRPTRPARRRAPRPC